VPIETHRVITARESATYPIVLRTQVLNALTTNGEGVAERRRHNRDDGRVRQGVCDAPRLWSAFTITVG
jgi:hypothetical protein